MGWPIISVISVGLFNTYELEISDKNNIPTHNFHFPRLTSGFREDQRKFHYLKVPMTNRLSNDVFLHPTNNC